LEVSGVTKRFGSIVTAQDLSFEVQPGRALGIVGPNGAGKSTLLNLVNGTLRPDAGRVVLEGDDVTATSASARCRRGVGRTYQVPRPFGQLSVFENVLVAASFGAGLRRQNAYDAAHAALGRAGMTAEANRPAGGLGLLDRKRLELARALATSPRLLLLDEIAGGLTDRELPQLVGTIGGLRDAGVTIVWIEHIVHALLEVVDDMLCLAIGRVVAHGDPHEVIRSQPVIDVYLGATAEATRPEGGDQA
jgi:branched-chain amino acid transport system ATP-binding protein